MTNRFAGTRAGRARRRLVVLVSSVAVLGAAAWPAMRFFDIPPFTDKGEPVSYGRVGRAVSGKPADTRTLLPTGPEAAFTNAETLGDGSKIGVVTLEGGKSGFTGKVWVWAPKEYTDDPKYAKSGFPVLIALPGGSGYGSNYWMGRPGGFSLQESVSEWFHAGSCKPFLLAMPVLNPGPGDKGIYWDGSDIPGQPKMGTWLTEDVPDLMRANFRTLKSRDGWAFMGSSTGGFAGLKAVLKHPDKFKAVIANGPDVVPDSPLWNGHEKEKAENNPEVLAKRLIDTKGPDVYLSFQVGTKENAATIRSVKDFMRSYGKGPVHTQLWEIPGGMHNGATYGANMAAPMKWISDHLEGPPPSP
ncbi:alpha/beta hydrolase-fold protein [Streptomyces abikoensis]|uniref:alpha/beta hydrolase n=1 Tax=Streptomyces abikoensis TaxID=97398 RepID=UPI0033F9D3B5